MSNTSAAPASNAQEYSSAIPCITSEQRKAYQQEEKEKGIRYCDIQNGWCLRLCETGKTSCKQCLTIMTHFT